MVAVISFSLTGESSSVLPSVMSAVSERTRRPTSSQRGKISHEQVLKHKAVMDIWTELGLQKISDKFDGDVHESGGSQLSDREGDEAP